MRTTNSSILVALLLSAISIACARVEADVKDVSVTRRALAFQGVPGGKTIGEVSITQSFTLGANELSWTKDMNADVYAYEVELKGVGKTEDLSFIRSAHVTMSDGAKNATATPVALVDYERPADAVSSQILSAPTLYPINVSSVWQSEKVVITLVLAGTFPEEGWEADVTLHLSGKLSYKFQ